MSNFTISKEKNTPEVVYSHGEGVLSISGRSYPEDALGFYTMVSDKLKTVQLSSNFRFQFDFEYINSSSIACILDLIKDQQALYPKTEFSIHISCHQSDEDMLDMGDHYQSITGIPVAFSYK